MDLSRPWAPIRSAIDMDVLRVLRRTTRPLTGREVARLVRSGSQPTVNGTLRRLSTEGLVHADHAGSAYLYRLNRDHIASPAIELLADVRAELERRLGAEVAAWEIAPAHLSVFGSAARGDGGTASDVDIFVVRPRGVSDDDARWRDQLARLSDRVLAWTGNHAGVSEVSEADSRRLRRERPPIVDEVLRDAITISGPEPADLLKQRP